MWADLTYPEGRVQTVKGFAMAWTRELVQVQWGGVLNGPRGVGDSGQGTAPATRRTPDPPRRLARR